MTVYTTQEVDIEVDISITDIYEDMSTHEKKELFNLFREDGEISVTYEDLDDQEFIKDFAYKIKYMNNSNFKLLLNELKHRYSDSLDSYLEQ